MTGFDNVVLYECGKKQTNKQTKGDTMPYISTEDVKAKRDAIKKAFPAKDGWKFSVTKENHSSINVNIMQAPFQMLEEGRDYEQVNHYYIEKHYEDQPKTRDVLLKIYEIINTSNYTVVVDAVPKFYTHISIGKWNKPFQVKGVA